MSKPKLIIYGNGSMAKVYAMYLQKNYDVVAYTVSKNLLTNNQFNGKPIVPFESVDSIYSPDEHFMVVAIGYVEMNLIRQTTSELCSQKGYQLVSFVHPNICTDIDFEIGLNSLFLDNGSAHSGTKIGKNVFISSGVHIGHDCRIGDNVWINSGVSIGGGSIIGDNTFIGMNSTLSQGVSIGENNFIGAATLVIKSTTNNAVTISPAGELLPMNSQTFLKFSKSMNHDKIVF